MLKTDVAVHWTKTRSLMKRMAIAWFVVGFGIHVFVNYLNEIVIFSFPLGYFLASQGALIVFVVMLFIFASRQDEIDRESGEVE